MRVLWATFFVTASLLALRCSAMRIHLKMDPNPSVAAHHTKAPVHKYNELIKEITKDAEYRNDLFEILAAFDGSFDACMLHFVDCDSHGLLRRLKFENLDGALNLSGLPVEVEEVSVSNSTLPQLLDLTSIPRTIKALEFRQVRFMIDKVAPKQKLEFTRRGLLRKFVCVECNIAEVDWSKSPLLEFVDLSNNAMNDFAFSKMPPTVAHLNLSNCNLHASEFNVKWPATLKSLDLSHNAIRGKLDCDWPDSLEELYLAGNELTGEVCATIPYALRVLDVSWNKLKGSIPDLAEYASLAILRLSHNRITEIASWARLPKQLVYLDLAHNNLVTAPPLTTLPANLETIDLAHNRIRGTIDLTKLPETLVSIDVSFNALSGHVDVENLPNGISYVFLQSNKFAGRLSLTELPANLRRIVFHSNDWDLRLPAEFTA